MQLRSRRAAAAVGACALALMCCAVILRGRGRPGRLLEWVPLGQLSVDPALLPDAAPVEGTFCCGASPSSLCSDASHSQARAPSTMW